MDAGQVTAVLSAVLLRIFPRVSAGEVPVAVAVKLPPVVLATFSICREREREHEVQKRAWDFSKMLLLAFSILSTQLT